MALFSGVFSKTIKQGAAPDNLEKGYHGKYAKESIKPLLARSPYRAFYLGIDS